MSPDVEHAYGPYRVIRPLGGGGMGTVLLAEDCRLGRLVALKTVAGAGGATAAARGRLLHEARAAARLAHPNIATVHDVLDIDGELVIVFEYVEGETLASRLVRGRLTVPEALRIGEQLAQGLAAAHAQGIVHRDLKPGNVMLTPDGRAKILDFGIAQSVTLDTEETSVSLATGVGLYAGTPAYAAPEQWLGEAVGAHTDIFALGLVLFEMLGGRRPFDTHSQLALMQQVIEAPRPRVRDCNPAVPASVDALVDSALAREPARRPPSAREVANLLRAIASDHVADDTGTVAGRPRLRRRTVAAIVLLVATVIGLIATLSNPEPSPAASAPPVVAVLPLTNATASGTNDYLAAGLADSLTNSLASLRGITVLSRSAVLGAWSHEPSPAHVARELGASYFVEGSVQQVGDRVRLSINLIRHDQSVAWADSAEGGREEVFELQSRLAAALGRALSVHVTAADRARLAQQPTADADALAAYWRGRALLERRDAPGNLDAALSAFDEAVKLDPRFATAHAARGEALWARYLQTRNATDAQSAILSSTTALNLDPENASARYSRALALEGTGRPTEAVEELDRVLSLQPTHDEARARRGWILSRLGRLDEGVSDLRNAIELRPRFYGHYSTLGVALFNAARYDEAIVPFMRVIELRPDSSIGYQQLGTTYQLKGEYDKALDHYRRAMDLVPTAQVLTNIAALHHLRGEYHEAITAARKSLEMRPNSHITQRNLGDAYLRVGQVEAASAAYRAAIQLAEQELQVNPRAAGTMAYLAVYLAKDKRQQDADRRMAAALAIAPDDVQVLYRAAVVDAIAGRREPALKNLANAIAHGFSRRTARDDEDFRALHDSPEFQRLVNTP